VEIDWCSWIAYFDRPVQELSFIGSAIGLFVMVLVWGGIIYTLYYFKKLWVLIVIVGIYLFIFLYGGHTGKISSRGNSSRQHEKWDEHMRTNPEFKRQVIKRLKHSCPWTWATGKRCELFWNKIGEVNVSYSQ